MKPANIAILIAIAGFVTLLVSQAGAEMSRYATFADAKAEARELHVVGEWVNRDAANYNPNTNTFRFYVKDSTGNTELVHYYEPKPMNLEQAEKVVLIGGYEGETFVAKSILQKCPSKYEENSVSGNGMRTTDASRGSSGNLVQ
jgi:cytochrome c-type biogenesis protein CcmE